MATKTRKKKKDESSSDSSEESSEDERAKAKKLKKKERKKKRKEKEKEKEDSSSDSDSSSEGKGSKGKKGKGKGKEKEKEKEVRNAVIWDEDVEAGEFLKYIEKNKASAGDGGNFKKPFWEACAVAIAPYRTKGPVKGHKACSNKWTAYRAIYTALFELPNASGLSWSETSGTDCSDDVWKRYIASHKEAKPFRHGNTWRHWDKMKAITPATIRKRNIFHPKQGTAPGTSQVREESPQWPEELLDHSEPGSPRPVDVNEQPVTSTPLNTPPPLPSPMLQPLPRFPSPSPSPMQGSPASVQKRKMPDTAVEERPRTRPSPSPSRPQSAALSSTPRRPEPSSSELSAAPYQRARVEKITPGEGLVRLSTGLEKVATAFLAGSSTSSDVQRTPQRKARAVKRVQELETGLDRLDMLDLIDIFDTNQRHADTYNGLDDDELRQAWVQRKLAEYRRSGFGTL